MSKASNCSVSDTTRMCVFALYLHSGPTNFYYNKASRCLNHVPQQHAVSDICNMLDS